MSNLEFNREQDLKNAGCENVKSYMLINNYGYTFTKDNVKYDLRHWLNCYGADVNFWALDGTVINGKNDKATGHGNFNNFDEALDYIKIL